MNNDKTPRSRPAAAVRKGRIANKRRRSQRRAAVIVWTSLIIVALIGMVGLVIDGGLLMNNYRHTQNVADSAALAAAMASFRGESDADSITAGETYVTDASHNNMPGATVTVSTPPTYGPYAGTAGYFEAIVSNTEPTYFIHVLPGINPGGSAVSGHAVAGGEEVPVGVGVMALDPDAQPGLKITGNSDVCVEGAVFVNSNGGGEDEWGENVGNGQVGSSVSNNAPLCADAVYVSGGVNDLTNFESNPPGGPVPLDAGTGTLYPDPLVGMPTPTTSNGVFDIDRGSPQATNGGLALNNPNDDPISPNYIENPGTPDETMVLQPGIYESIKVTGGLVRFTRGIYVLRPQSNVSFTVEITGGTITQDPGGLMFYNTFSDYDPVSGAPDASDGSNPPPDNFPSGDLYGGDFKINASVGLSPLDDNSSPFDNMLIYYRRWHDGDIQIEGNSADGDLSGVIYAPWGTADIAGQGTLNTMILAGSIEFSGSSSLTIAPDDDSTILVEKVFLVD